MTTTTAPPNTLDRHLADCFAAADAYDARAVRAINAGDAEAADECWATASLLRISAHMIQRTEAVAA